MRHPDFPGKYPARQLTKVFEEDNISEDLRNSGGPPKKADDPEDASDKAARTFKEVVASLTEALRTPSFLTKEELVEIIDDPEGVLGHPQTPEILELKVDFEENASRNYPSAYRKLDVEGNKFSPDSDK